MNGTDALTLLRAGYILRRKAWEPDIKCKAYFSDDMKSVKINIDDPKLYTTEESLGTNVIPISVQVEPQFIVLVPEKATKVTENSPDEALVIAGIPLYVVKFP